RQITPPGRNGASRCSDAQNASTRCSGSVGPPSSGNGRIEGTSGTADADSSLEASNASSASASPPSGSFISQTPIPLSPASDYARTSSRKLPESVVTCETDSLGAPLTPRSCRQTPAPSWNGLTGFDI